MSPTSPRMELKCAKCSSVKKGNYKFVCVNCYHRIRYSLKPWAYLNNTRKYRSKPETKEKAKKSSAEWAKKNPVKVRAKSSKYYRTEKSKWRMKRWRLANPERVVYDTAKRRKSVKVATPRWVDQKEIKKVYLNKPEGMQVDHIVPLRGKNVSGLHVPWNLQYLTPSQNYAKGNNWSK